MGDLPSQRLGERLIGRLALGPTLAVEHNRPAEGCRPGHFGTRARLSGSGLTGDEGDAASVLSGGVVEPGQVVQDLPMPHVWGRASTLQEWRKRNGGRWVAGPARPPAHDRPRATVGRDDRLFVPQSLPQCSDDFPGRGRPSARIERQCRSEAPDHAARCGGIHHVQHRGVLRNSSGDQGDRRGGERVDIGCARLRLAFRQLRCDEAHRPLLVEPIGGAEVDQDNRSIRCQDDVLGFHVTVDKWWVVFVKVIQRPGDLFEVGDDERGRQSRVAVVGQDPLEVHTLDPVGDQHTVASFDEAVDENREVRVDLDPPDERRLRFVRTAVGLRGDIPDLKCDRGAHSSVVGEEHPTFRAAPHSANVS